MTPTVEELSYPIGRFTAVAANVHARRESIAAIAALPERLRGAVAGLDDRQLDTPYRRGGWNVRQVVHHVADSHINAFVRLKLALTEERPVVVAYDEKKFAELTDATLPVTVSLGLIEGLHRRWLSLYSDMADTQWARVFRHPEYPEPMTLDTQLQLYAWHSRHHVAHITALRRRERW